MCEGAPRRARLLESKSVQLVSSGMVQLRGLLWYAKVCFSPHHMRASTLKPRNPETLNPFPCVCGQVRHLRAHHPGQHHLQELGLPGVGWVAGNAHALPTAQWPAAVLFAPAHCAAHFAAGPLQCPNASACSQQTWMTKEAYGVGLHICLTQDSENTYLWLK